MKPLIRTYKAGTYLFHENDRSRELYIVQSGNVKICKINSGREVEITVLGKGSVLGEMALIDGKPRSASAKAIDDCTAVIIDAETFNQKIAGVPGWFMTIIKMASQKIRLANQQLNATQCKNEKARIVIAILHLFRKYHYNNTVPLQSIHSNLISLLGVTYQTSSMVIDYLCKHKFTIVENDQLSIVVFSQYCEYCDFLRLIMRNAYNSDLSIHDDIGKILIAVSNEYSEILHGNEPQTIITGTSLWNILTKCNLEKSFNSIIIKLQAQNFITGSKSDIKPAQTKDNPLAAYNYKISNTKWKKTCLYAKFKQYMIIS